METHRLLQRPIHMYDTTQHKFQLTQFFSLAFFLGGNPVLREDSIIHSSKDRQRLRTEAMGTIYIRLGIMLRNFEKFGVEVG